MQRGKSMPARRAACQGPAQWRGVAGKAAALAMQGRAYVPYSEYRVGAALLTSGGEIVTGCNVENATYGATCCAERTAVFSAVAAGHTSFRAIAVATHGADAGVLLRAEPR